MRRSSRRQGRRHADGSYASFPDYLDPQLSYTAEGWTAMYNTYIPLLTYAHADGEAGSKVIPGLAESLPKITNGGKTYTLNLRKGLKYSDGTPVKASDFTYAVERHVQGQLRRLALLHGHRRRRRVRRNARRAASRASRPTTRPARSTIDLTEPRGTFTNELGLLFAAPVPAGHARPRT